MSLTSDDLQKIRMVIREEVDATFETRGRAIVREEVDATFEAQGRTIIREEVDATFEAQGRTIIREEVRSTVATELAPVKESLARLEGKVEALENDIKDIYGMLSDLQKVVFAPSTNKLSLEEKIRQAHANVLVIAKQAGVQL